jgi:excisionase family DNA binding protein
MNGELPIWLTVKEAAACFRTTAASIRGAIRRGELRALRIGRLVRIHRDSLLLGQRADVGGRNGETKINRSF